MADSNQNPQVFPMNPAQKAAAEAKNGPLLIVAGAGTGKTKTLTSRILYLIEHGTPPSRICAITFTNKAAKEMAHRVHVPGPLISTFHSLGARILRKECRHLGRTPNFVIFDDHDSFDLVKKAVKSVLPKPPKGESDEGGYGLSAIKPKLNKKEAPAFFAQKISEIKNKDGVLGELKAAIEADAKNAGPRRTPSSTSDATVNKNILAVFEKYEAALERNNAFDFDDLIEKTVKLFKENPAVLKKYQSMFDVILVDEYQDINPKQCELITLLAEGHRNLSVVGDDEQTIYSWRYADIKTFLDFDRDWKGASVYFLEENYRSTGTIIRAASSVVKNNSFRTPKNLWTNNADGDRIMLFEAWGEQEEAEWIGQEIGKLRGRGDDDIAILYRTNAQSRAIEQGLIRRNIPYKIFGGLKFYERREVKDAIAALRYASNEKDELAQERLEKNLTKRKFAEFRARLAKRLLSGGTTGEAIELSPTEMLKLFLETFNYIDYLEANFVNADEREENIGELVAFASEFKTLPEFLERLSLVQSTDDATADGGENGGGGGNGHGGGSETSGDARTHGNHKNRSKEVSLMTIHLAKGLEFDTVFISGAAEGFLPHGRSLESEMQLEEERRLMYVAMTRARKRLFISFYGIPSRFIAEIPDDCVTFYGAGDNEAGEEKGDVFGDDRSNDSSSPHSRNASTHGEDGGWGEPTISFD